MFHSKIIADPGVCLRDGPVALAMIEGALIGAVWNYAASSFVTWRK